MARIIFGITVSYLIGSIPTAYIFGRVLKGIDIRRFGSGNIGATNVLRVLGRVPAAAVLFLDILKGFISVVIIGNLLSPSPAISDSLWRIILGVSCISGHNWTVFLRFRGGKGVATTLGVLLGLSLEVGGLGLILGLAVLTWIAVFIITRIVSLASVVTAVSFPILMFLFKQDTVMVVSTALLAVFIILRHKANIKRILQGKEPTISFKKP